MAAGTPVWFVAAVAGLATTMALAIDVLWATRVMEAAIVPIACAVAFHAVALGGWVGSHDAAAKVGQVGSSAALIMGATVLTGKLRSMRLALSPNTLADLRRVHGPELEGWWQDRFGHAFDRLTESEARYLARTPDAQRVRDRIAEAEREGDRRED